MGVRILSNRNDTAAALYCSTSDWAFGPVFSDLGFRGAEERAESFLRFLEHRATAEQVKTYEANTILGGSVRSVRLFSDQGLSRAYYDWFRQEEEQWAAEEAEEQRKHDELMREDAEYDEALAKRLEPK